MMMIITHNLCGRLFTAFQLCGLPLCVVSIYLSLCLPVCLRVSVYLSLCVCGLCVSSCLSVSVCGLCLYSGRDDDFERTKKTDFKGEYQGMKEEPVVLYLSLYVSLSVCLFVCLSVPSPQQTSSEL